MMPGPALRPRIQCLHSRRTFTTSTCLKSDSVLPPPRLDYKGIAQNHQFKSHNAFNRRAPVSINAIKEIVKLHQEQVGLGIEVSHLRGQRAVVGEKIRTGDEVVKEAAKTEAASLKQKLHKLERKLETVENNLLYQALTLPNDTHPDTPLGPEAAAVVRSIHGPPPIEASPKRDHVELNRYLNFMDLQAGSLASGSSWYFLKKEGALLELALTNYAISMAAQHGFTPVLTPDVVKEDVATRCGFQPRDEGAKTPSQNYYLQRTKEEPQLVLSGTAEIPLSALCAGKILEPRSLPQKFVGLGRAFRAEAGARGADTRGLYRVHQFSKVELFVVCEGKESEKQMEEMRELQENIFNGLGLTFRVLDMPTEELGASAYRKYDMEAWMPGRGAWGEISSLSNCTDFQARRLHIRYKPSEPVKPRSQGLPFAHTLNGTAAAIPRLILALIENGALFDEQGRVTGLNLPNVLRPFWLGPASKKIVWT